MANPYTTLSSIARHTGRMSKRVIFSYIFDWFVMGIFLALIAAFHYTDSTGSRHAFSLQDPSLSYPHTQDLVSNPVLYFASILLPAVIIAAVCLIIVPGPSSKRTSPARTRRLWQRKLWELHTGWFGLVLSVLGTLVITNGLKALAGKPRPHLLAVCDPDLSAEAIARWRVGGLGGLNSTDDVTALATAPVVVTWQICRNTNAAEMDNAFASWPSGHASTSWSGLLYLTLWFCAKFGVGFPTPVGLRWPMLSDNVNTHDDGSDGMSSEGPRTNSSSIATTQFDNTGSIYAHSLRNQSAAPPAYLILLAAVPVGTAIFISISRWFDYRHDGFDIISGAAIGIFCAWLSFRLYQTPVTIGDGWAWAPRTKSFAFGTLVGRGQGINASSLTKATAHDQRETAIIGGGGGGGGGGGCSSCSSQKITTSNVEKDDEFVDVENQPRCGGGREPPEEV